MKEVLSEFVTVEFLKAAIAEGAHLKQPEKITAEAWVKQRNMTGIYFGTRLSKTAIAKLYNYSSREWPRQIIKDGLQNLWHNCSFEIQQQFPLSEMSDNKQLLPKRKDWMFLANNIYLANKLGVVENDHQIQQLLNKVPSSFYQRDTRQGHPLLTPISNITREGKFYYYPRNAYLFEQALQEAGIPIGRLEIVPRSKAKQRINRYIFISSKHKERALQTFLQDPQLKRFLTPPIQQICGKPADQLPQTTEFKSNKSSFKPIRPVFEKLGIVVRGSSKVWMADFLTEECPVPVFCYQVRRVNPTRVQNYYRFPADQEEALSRFIKTSHNS